MNTRYRLIIPALLMLMGLAACGSGGGGGGTTPATSTLTLFAGNMGGPGSADGTGAAASFKYPSGITSDSAGNIFVADTSNNTIRKITPAGVVTTFAGSAGSSGSADGTGSTARFYFPTSVAIDSSNNLYVADSGSHTIRKITPARVVTTHAGAAGVIGSADGPGTAARFKSPYGIAIDSSNNVYVTDSGNFTIRRITPAGVVSTLAGTAGLQGSADGTGVAARFNYPRGLAADSAGNVYVADSSNHTIRKITQAGVVTTFAGAALFFGSTNGNGTAARFQSPFDIASDGAGNFYVADYGNYAIRKITSTGDVTTFAGGVGGFADGPGATARFNTPAGVAIDSAGNVYVSDKINSMIRKITPAAEVTTLAGSVAVAGSNDGTGAAATFDGPQSIATDTAGNVYVADSNNNTIRKITTDGLVTTLAGTAGVAGSADGTGAAASFSYPTGVAADSAGNVYVADNATIRKIAPGGVVTTFAGTAGVYGSADGTGAAASFGYVYGVAIDSAGNMYVSDQNNSTIRKITPAGEVSTLAGVTGAFGSADGTGSSARFGYPGAIATDSTGNIYVVDNSNYTIRKITPTGVVTTLAGTAGVIGNADGTGAAASFSDTSNGIATDSEGNVYVADTNNHTIRKITPAGLVSTVVGVTGRSGFTEGALPGLLAYPTEVAVHGSSLYITLLNGVAVVRNLP